MERHTKSKSQYAKTLIILIATFYAIVSLSMYSTINAEGMPHSSHIVMDSSSGRVLSGDNIHARLPMASTTKVMTALVALENSDLDALITITHDMVGIEGSSIYLIEGERITLEDLLYGLMLRSGNDAATAIAIAVGGSVQGFVDMMNSKAETLKLRDTHFVNPHGLHDDDHYTSAYDLAVIASHAMHNSAFAKIVGTKSHVTSSDSDTKRYFVNKNKILSMYQYGNGIKTGYTKKAGRCLVSSAYRDNMQLVSVVLGESDMWRYSIDSMDRAFSEYTMLDIATANHRIEDVVIDGIRYPICIHKDLKYPIKADERDLLSYDIVLDKGIKKVSKGQNIGKLLVYYNKHLLFEEKIYTM